MALEMAVSRIAAYCYGGTIYSWTISIGIILTGFSIGNYIGGRLAGTVQNRKLLALFCAGISFTLFISILINNYINTNGTSTFQWPLNIAHHLVLIAFLPCLCLGGIPPISANIILSKTSRQGAALGNTYSTAAVGSIAGLFITGYYLIDLIGTASIIWSIICVFLLFSITLGFNQYRIHLLVLFLLCVSLTAFLPDTLDTFFEAARLKEKKADNILYEDESQYSHITIKKELPHVDIRSLLLDKLIHSTINMDHPNSLCTPYLLIYTGLTEQLAGNTNPMRFLIIGGGGYVFPRYLKSKWPTCQIDIIEIDPAITKAAIEAFGLQTDSGFNIIHQEARQYINNRTGRISGQSQAEKYDFIFLDAVNDFSVPYQLITKEFHEKIEELLSPDGIFAYVVIDILDHGRFLGSNYETLNRTFEHTYVLYQDIPGNMRNTFILIASNRSLNTKTLLDYDFRMDVKLMDHLSIKPLVDNKSTVVLTDDFAPIESLLLPVFRDYFKTNIDTNP